MNQHGAFGGYMFQTVECDMDLKVKILIKLGSTLDAEELSLYLSNHAILKKDGEFYATPKINVLLRKDVLIDNGFEIVA